MSTVETVLVIMLSVGFLVLLTLSIIIASFAVIIMRRVNEISKQAQNATSNISEAAAKLSSKIAPIAISTLVGLITKKFKSRKGAR